MGDTKENLNRIKSRNLSSKRGYLNSDCASCFGLCCVALYFSASEGFPTNKDAGEPCIHLQSDFRCKVHQELRQMGLKGCTAYDCFGAGQKVAQNTYVGKDWRQAPQSAKQMYDVFVIMRQLHEMLWYLTQAAELSTQVKFYEEVNQLFHDTEQLTHLDADSLIKLDIAAHRTAVNAVLRHVIEFIQSKASNQRKTISKDKRTFGLGLDLMGANLKGKDLSGMNLSGAYLIAANLKDAKLADTILIGADLRDTDLRGADLSSSIFLTQAQLSSAKGDVNTKLPGGLIRPVHWEKEY